MQLGWGGDGAAQILEIPARLRPARSCSWARWALERILAFPRKEDEHLLGTRSLSGSPGRRTHAAMAVLGDPSQPLESLEQFANLFPGRRSLRSWPGGGDENGVGGWRGKMMTVSE